MARTVETLVTQSVLDRLIATEDWPATRAQSIRFLKEAMKRDMEWLLNTRQALLPAAARTAPDRKSVVQYGLIDTSVLSFASANDHRVLQQAIYDSILAFEPRLKNLRVVVEEGTEKKRQLRFHIEAQIRLDPAPEEITFDTVLDLTSGEYTVS